MKKFTHVNPPEKWEAKEELDRAVDKLVLYEVIIKDEKEISGYKYGKYRFHRNFIIFLNRTVNLTIEHISKKQESFNIS
jgi:hypothetical protein